MTLTTFTCVATPQKINRLYVIYSLLFIMLFAITAAPTVSAAPKSKLLGEWFATVSDSTVTVDHQHWQTILDRYVVVQQQQSYVDYAALVSSPDDRALLAEYIQQMAEQNPLLLNRQQQQAYWINLYNALTVQLIADNYPITSITKLGKGLFTFGPWDQELIEVNQQVLSLNNIEHGILRPIFNDPRIHYAVNCASLGCPSLLPTAFTAKNVHILLDQAADEFINHPRAITLDGDRLTLSKIYQWYIEDFGSDVAGVIAHIKQYANAALSDQLSTINTDTVKVNYEYDWELNKVPR